MWVAQWDGFGYNWNGHHCLCYKTVNKEFIQMCSQEANPKCSKYFQLQRFLWKQLLCSLARKEIISDFKLLANKYSGRMWKGLQNVQDLCNNMKCSLINLCLKLDFYDKQLDELLGEKGNAFKGEGNQVPLRNCYIFLASIHQYLQTLPLGSYELCWVQGCSYSLWCTGTNEKEIN